MVRRTKEESLETRRLIVDAARIMFEQHGVARTSMEQVAAAAGVTRGAIYWHFANKVDLFHAMREEVHVPLTDLSNLALDAAHASSGVSTLDPLERIETFLTLVIEHIANDDTTRSTLRIANFKCEYVDAFAHDLDVACDKYAELRAKLADVYRQARRARLLRDRLSPALAATDTMVFLLGLVRMWLFDEDGDLVQKRVRQLIAQHIAGKRRAGSDVATRSAHARRRVVARARRLRQSMRNDVRNVSTA